jgi:hypothetical protein
MPTFDSDLMTRSTGNLTQSESSSGKKIRGTGVKGMAAYIVLPSTTGTSNQVLPRVWVSDDDSTYRLAATYPGGPQSWASGGKEFVVPFATDKKYALTELVISGSTGTVNYGAVKAGFVLGVGYDWNRAVAFE